MSIKVQWENTTTGVIRMAFGVDWSLEAYYHSIAALDAMLYNYPGRVTVLMDMSATDQTPTMRVPRGREMDEDRVLCRAARLVIINPGYFMPNVTCPVEVAGTLDQAYDLVGMVVPAT
jgi:hypothetical protein